jgi:two-component system response regulator RegA
MVDARSAVRTVLVVDDDERLLAAYERALERRYRVLLATTSAHGLALARTRRPDVAIVDLQLKLESGLELIRALKAHDPNMFVVLISGYASVEVAVAAIRAGADDVMPKPVTASEILDRLAGPRIEVPVETPTLERAQWEHIHRVLADCGGNISMAARRLGMYRSTLQRWLRRTAPRSHAG